MGLDHVNHGGYLIAQIDAPPAEYEDYHGPNILQVRVDFTVTAVPDAAGSGYAALGRATTGDTYLYSFHAAPFSLESVRMNDEFIVRRSSNDVGPYLLPGVESQPILAFPYLPPLADQDPRLHRVITSGLGHKVKSRIQRQMDGVVFTQWYDDPDGETRPTIFYWRYGDPWWTSMVQVCKSAASATQAAPVICRWGFLQRSHLESAPKAIEGGLDRTH